MLNDTLQVSYAFMKFARHAIIDGATVLRLVRSLILLDAVGEATDLELRFFGIVRLVTPTFLNSH